MPCLVLVDWGIIMSFGRVVEDAIIAFPNNHQSRVFCNCWIDFNIDALQLTCRGLIY